MNARRNISARARKRHAADLDGLLASAVSVASGGGENAPCRRRTPGRLIAICPAFGNIARARVASPRTAARVFASFRGQFGWSWPRGRTLEIAGNLWATRFRYL